MDLERLSIPFYLNPDSPNRRPIMSHHASAHNIVLKVVVPKRTGRKRKRGSNDPFEGEIEMVDAEAPQNQVYSQSRLDNPKVLRRKMQDNVDRYHVEAVGIAKGVHRFRGMLQLIWHVTPY
jgi:general transcription factor 3C polypeptide 5 (transcription factor C subunit 1)